RRDGPAHADDGAERADAEGHRDEVGPGGVHAVPTGRDEMAHLVGGEDAEEAGREGNAGADELPEGGRLGRPARGHREDRARPEGGEHGSHEGEEVDPGELAARREGGGFLRRPHGWTSSPLSSSSSRPGSPSRMAPSSSESW